MDSLQNITQTLSELKSISKKISSYILPIAKELKEESGEFYDYYIENSKSKELSKDNVGNVLIELTNDPLKSLSELDTFAKAIVDNEPITTVHEKCPFLSRAWSGDLYDAQGLDGLKELKKELDQEYNRCSYKYIIQRSMGGSEEKS